MALCLSVSRGVVATANSFEWRDVGCQNFRHDKRGSQVVEIRREEYERSKQDILAKIRRRLVILGVVIGVMALISLSLGGVRSFV